MDYNSQREKLIIPEYGRNVQHMIEYALTIEDDEYRQHFVERIVDLMYQMNPQSKNLLEYQEKLWKHVFRIAQYKLKVVPTNGEVPSESDSKVVPDKLDYPPNEKSFRHYGHNVKELVKKALEMDDLEKRQEFVNVIGSYMKMAYRTWNREHYVSDEIIKGDLQNMSDGKLVLSDDVSLDTLNFTSNRKKRSNYHSKNDKRGDHRNRNNKNRRRR